jgi:hypothetical protein
MLGGGGASTTSMVCEALSPPERTVSVTMPAFSGQKNGNASRRAFSNRSRTRAAPTPTSDSTNSEPESEKNAALTSPAVARPKAAAPTARGRRGGAARSGGRRGSSPPAPAWRP